VAEDIGFIGRGDWEALQAQEEERDRQRIEAIRQGTAELQDATAADELVRWIADTMTEVATGRVRIEEINQDYRARHRALVAVLRRLRIENPIPFSDLWAFYEYWSASLGDTPAEEPTSRSWSSRSARPWTSWNTSRSSLRSRGVQPDGTRLTRWW
jgi:hypothetical protein